MSLHFIVPPAQNNWPVRDILRAAGVSSTALRRAKRTPPGITADGVPVFANARVAAGVTLALPDVPENAGTVTPQDIPVQVVWENADAALLEKPAGMPVHPTLGYADGTLANAWLGLLARRAGEGQGSGAEPAAAEDMTTEMAARQTGFHPIWRLDRDTSGLLLLAKSGAVQPFLQRDCRKLYAAVLAGRPPCDAGTVDAPIGRAPDSIIARQVDAAGAAAVTHYRVLAANQSYSLAVFSLGTGRTHQIRVHMAHLGCPVAGDTLYGRADAAFARQALHCAAAAFTLPDGRRKSFFSPLPAPLLSAAGLADSAGLLRQYYENWHQGL